MQGVHTPAARCTFEMDKCHVHQSFLLKGGIHIYIYNIVQGGTIRHVMATDPSQCTMHALICACAYIYIYMWKGLRTIL